MCPVLDPEIDGHSSRGDPGDLGDLGYLGYLGDRPPVLSILHCNLQARPGQVRLHKHHRLILSLLDSSLPLTPTNQARG